MQREQIDVGITVDVLIHFHCIFGGDRTKRRINFCTKYKFLHRRRTFQGRPIQHSVTRRLCPRSGNDSCTCLPIQCSREAQVWDSPYPLITLFCNGGNGDEVTGGSTPCCWEKRDCQKWISQSNNRGFQLLSSVKQRFKLWFHQFLADISKCQFFHAQDFSRPACEQYGPTYWEAWKRIEMATSHVTPLSSACLLREHQGQ